MTGRQKVVLGIVDPTWDFSWPGLGHSIDLSSPEWKAAEPLLRMALGPMLDDLINPGKLFVPGAWEAMERAADMLVRIVDRVDDIFVFLDAHQIVDQGHPVWFKDRNGNEAAPFTNLEPTPDGQHVQGHTFDPANGNRIELGQFTTIIPSLMHQGGVTGEGSLGYLKALHAKGRYPHTIWPVHMEIGAIGTIIVPKMMNALRLWQQRFAVVNFISKGANIHTEHYSGIVSEVSDPEDETTQLNEEVVTAMAGADIIGWLGIAENFCLANTVVDTADTFCDPNKPFSDPDLIKRMTLITDGTAAVPGLNHLTDAFYAKMRPLGMQECKCAEFLA